MCMCVGGPWASSVLGFGKRVPAFFAGIRRLTLQEAVDEIQEDLPTVTWGFTGVQIWFSGLSVPTLPVRGVPVGNRGLCTVSVLCCFMTGFTSVPQSALVVQVYLTDHGVIWTTRASSYL